MTTSVIKSSFAAGEVSPALWGHVDLSKYATGCATLRNMYVGIRGGAYSRAGTRFCGQAKQPASAASTPPRIIPFQFKVGQSYIIELGDSYARFITNGSYVTEAPLTITGATQANPCTLTIPGHTLNNGNSIFVSGVNGMTQLNNETFVVANSNQGAGTLTLNDTFGNPVNSLSFSAYVSGGTAARIYTISMPYAAADLNYLKFAQSADVMSMTLSNPTDSVEYAPFDLSRLASNNWAIAATSFASSISAPTSCTATPSTVISSLSTTTNAPAAQYAYCVTAIDAKTGQESQASPIGYTPNSTSASSSVDISITAGSVTVTWPAVAGASRYNIYKAPAAVWNTGSAGTATPQSVPVGSSFGFAGFSYGNSWVDQNVVQDFTTTPPLHLNPFAQGTIQSVGTIGGTTTFHQSTTTATINTSTGSGAVILPVVAPNGTVGAAVVTNGGQNYRSSDTVTFADSNGGATVTAPLNVGPLTGTYPGFVGYFQERRDYANTLNNPDTYFLTQPGAFTNMDAADPPIDSDAITGTPWAQQVNGVQWMVPVPAGLLIFTGLDCWVLEGTSGPATPVTPASQSATAQEANGCSPTVPPIKINYQILFVQALGSIVRALNYNYFTNTYAGEDLTLLSNHLFDGHTIVQWAWAREPYKIVWAVRDDGVLLSLTYLKEQDIIAWARHDTNGQVVSIAVASEPPVDAVYIVVKRFIKGKNAYAYYVERMDNRLWPTAESVWAVDAGLSLALAQPNAALTASSAAVGTGVVYNATAPVFDGVTTGVVGQIIRMGGGKAQITAYVSPTQVVATNLIKITALTPNDPTNTPLPAQAGNWTIGTPVTTIQGLNHLEGMQVTGLADGAVISPTTVVNGSITLPTAASAVTVGLGYQAQAQSLPIEVPSAGTIQGKRKMIPAITVRLEQSRGVKLGANQPNASEQENYANVPWGQPPYGKMIAIPEVQNQLNSGNYLPLFTGDHHILVDDDWNNQTWSEAPGMVAAQQDFPLPMNLLAFIPQLLVGDSHTKGDPP